MPALQFALREALNKKALYNGLDVDVPWYEDPKYTAQATDGTMVRPVWIGDYLNQRYMINGSEVSYSDMHTTSRASSGTYFNSSGVLQNAGNDVPRFDYDPVTLQPRGLIVEQAKTNFLLNSSAPATQTTGNLSTQSYILWVNGSGSATVSAGTAVGTGFGVATEGSPVALTITTAGTVNVTVAGTLTRFQLENTTIPTSFIPTAGATAARAPDIINANNFPWNMSEGSFICSAMVRGIGVQGRVIYLGSVAGAEMDSAGFAVTTAGSRAVEVRSGNANSFSVGSANMGAMVSDKYGLGMKSADYAFVLNGSVISTTGAGPMPAQAVDSIALGRRNLSSNSQFINGWISQILYYPKRLTNAEIQRLAS